MSSTKCLRLFQCAGRTSLLFARSTPTAGGAVLIRPPSAGLTQQGERHLSTSAAVRLDDFPLEDESWEHDETTTRRKRTHKHGSDPKHCISCTCPKDRQSPSHLTESLHHFENPLLEFSGDVPQEQARQFSSEKAPFSAPTETDRQSTNDYPPPLPEPKVTFRRRVLPEHLVALSSPSGQQALVRAMVQQTASTYFMLTQHWDNQSDPASCGVTTLRQVLNAAGMDPTAVRWKGGWRYYGSDAMVVCRCMDPIRIQRAGITLDDFDRLAHCHGLQGRMERPEARRNLDAPTKDDSPVNTIDDFRRDLLHSLQSAPSNSDNVAPPTFLVVSFSRAVLQQTGDGHFSTVAAYDAETDSCLVLDVARFKYPPYWVRVSELYEAMRPKDPATNESRGWSLWRRAGPWPNYLDPIDGNVKDEGALPAAWVPAFDETNDSTCPLRPIQVQYCSTAWGRRIRQQESSKQEKV